MILSKKWICFCVAVMMATFLAGCNFRRLPSPHPSEQANTTWSTEDGSICFTVEGTYDPAYGYINLPEGRVEIAISMSPTNAMMAVSYAEDVRDYVADAPIQPFALWSCTDYSEEYIVVTVKQTKYLEEGQTLTFYRK